MAKGVILNEDLLWMIFTLVAEDDQKNMSNRLQCVLNGTLVCRQWRRCLLSAKNVWGRLIFVDSNRPREKKPTLELLELVAKRSGNTSPLFIEATATRHGVDTGLRLFLCQLMEEAWERIQEIHFELIDDTRDQQIRKRTRAVIARPAPNLRIFRVYGSDFNITHDNDFMFILNKYDKLFSEGVYPADRAVPPFANFAPRLEEFFVGHIYFPQQAAWLSGLRSLVVAYDCNALWIAYRSLPQLLEALQSMPRLESLECRLQDFHRRESPQEGKYVDLPNLKYMLLSAHPDICTFLRDHIRGAQTGCLLHLELMVDEYLESDGSNFMSLGDVFSTTLQRNMALASPPAQHITSMTMFLCDYRMVFHPKLQSARFGTIPTIRFDHYAGCERKENQGLLVALLSVFSHFKDITTLKLGRLDMGNYYIKCLLSMTSVTTLEAWFSGTLYWLTFIRWNGTDHVIFPKLQTLRVHIDEPRGLGDNQEGLKIERAYRPNRISQAIIAFFDSRSGLEPVPSIQQLEIDCTDPDYSDALTAIQQTAQEVIAGLRKFDPPTVCGLRIRWMKSWEREQEEYMFDHEIRE